MSSSERTGDRADRVSPVAPPVLTGNGSPAAMPGAITVTPRAAPGTASRRSSLTAGSIAWLAALLVAPSLAGCGYRLVGSPEMPPAMQRTYIAAEDTFSEFYRELARALRDGGVELVEDPTRATAKLLITGDDTGQRVLSVSAQNVPREFEVYYSVTYALTADGRSVLEPKSLTLTRDYTWDETEVLGKAQEEAVLRTALVEELVRRVLRRLASAETEAA